MGFHRDWQFLCSSRKVVNYLNHFIIDSLPLLLQEMPYQGGRVGALRCEEYRQAVKLASPYQCASRKPISVHCLAFWLLFPRYWLLSFGLMPFWTAELLPVCNFGYTSNSLFLYTKKWDWKCVPFSAGSSRKHLVWVLHSPALPTSGRLNRLWLLVWHPDCGSGKSSPSRVVQTAAKAVKIKLMSA